MTGDMLSIRNHDRDAAGLTYVYPVVSRRAGGVSVGINLNPNNACNWRCIYCQVPNLTRGVAPKIDLALLETELRSFLDDVINGSFMQERVPEEARQLKDIAISGNGEPTSCQEIHEVVQMIGKVMQDFDLVGNIRLTMITNGSYLGRDTVRQALKALCELGGRVWVKVDSATSEGMRRINNVKMNPDALIKQIELIAELCPTWIQTCMFEWQGEEPAQSETDAYLAFLDALRMAMVPIRGVLLYGPARRVMQPEAGLVSELPVEWMQQMAGDIEDRGFIVRLNI